MERINNSLGHEIAHFLLGHPHGQMQLVDGQLLRGYDEAHERQADWLGGVLLLPDTAIQHAARRGWSPRRPPPTISSPGSWSTGAGAGAAWTGTCRPAGEDGGPRR